MNFEIPEVVIGKLTGVFNLKEHQYDFDSLIEDIAEALKLIGAAKLFAIRQCNVTVENKTFRMPRDLESIRSVHPDIPYQQIGEFVQIDIKDGETVQLEYQAMPVDERGYVLVPDNVVVREAVMWYLAKNLILGGTIKTVSYGFAEQEWQWRCGSAQATMNVMSISAWAKVQSDFVTLNPRSTSLNPNIKYNLDREKHRSGYGRR
jgi:hypothetical protein